MKTSLPIGFHQFHRNKFYNYQLNRWHSEGYTRPEDLKKAAAAIKTNEDYKNVFAALAKEAVAEGRLKNAAFYMRAAEFLARPTDPDKERLYDQFIELFYQAFSADNIERYEVPFAGGALPAMRLAPVGVKKGTVLIHGGFDSLIEEFYAIWKLFSEDGYEVIAFEGPGQGGALRKHRLAFDHAWEKPTGAILDYFNLSDVTLLGISMGGYWCLRAAAFEKRIRRVIVFPPVYDWMESASGFARTLVDWMMKWEGLMRRSVLMKMRMPAMEHVINHTLFITQKDDPLDVVRWQMSMNKEFLHSDRVDQDVLLLGGEKDSFQPPVLFHKQWKALTHARSVTGRLFTEAEQAANHCGMGNLGLVVQVMLNWMEEKNREAAVREAAMV
ncbi:MAG: alpha/beta fold hydrolase [Chloroflexi bacterium]|nr:alpha/beta fold hydrolase [Chloroflexota bacterium]